VELHQKAGKMAAAAFLRNLIAAVPYRLHIVLTDNVLRAEGNERTVKVSLFVSMLSPHDARQVA
jgi:hypothetical protein